MRAKDTDGMANSVDPDQTALLSLSLYIYTYIGAVRYGSALFAQTYLSETLDHYGIMAGLVAMAQC